MGVVIISVLSFFIVWIGFPAENPKESFKDALEFSGGLFGGLTTFGAAIVAAHLFNDWKYQHNKSVEKEIAWDVIQKFDIVDTHLAQFKNSFYLFKFKYNYLYEMSGDECNNLNGDLQKILLELKGVTLELGSYLESLRKYSVVAENTYFEDHRNHVSKINSKLFALQNLKITFPTSIDDIENAINEIISLVVQIESSNINTLLTELKALK